MTDQRDVEICRLQGEVQQLRMQLADHGETITRLEIDNERLRAALESIAKNTCCDRCQEAALVARHTLAKPMTDINHAG